MIPVTGSLPREIESWSKLWRFSVADNELYGPVPNFDVADPATVALFDVSGSDLLESCLKISAS